MPALDTKKLRELAEAATQDSPWSVRNIKRTERWPHDDSYNVLDANGHWVAECGPAPHDAAFIAAANPQAVIALLEENESLRERLRDEFAVGAEYQRQAAVAQAEVERLRGYLAFNHTSGLPIRCRRCGAPIEREDIARSNWTPINNHSWNCGECVDELRKVGSP